MTEVRSVEDLKSHETGSPVTKADGPSGSKLHPARAISSRPTQAEIERSERQGDLIEMFRREI